MAKLIYQAAEELGGVTVDLRKIEKALGVTKQAAFYDGSTSTQIQNHAAAIPFSVQETGYDYVGIRKETNRLLSEGMRGQVHKIETRKKDN